MYLHRLTTAFITLAILLHHCSNLFAQGLSEQESRKAIQFRQVGHLLLRAAGDHTSRIMPVQQTAANTYRISFENPFTFIPDSLANIATQLMKAHLLPVPYTLSVTIAGSSQIVYGFTSEDVIKGTVPCIGRIMPPDNYVINIQVPVSNNAPLYYTLIAGLLMSVAVVTGRQFYKRKKPNNPDRPLVVPAPVMDIPGIAIGAYLFIPDKGILRYAEETISLTPKEQTLLNIFVKQINQVIDRNLLLKEGWEDEGVITGRSLDMYVSKLRKKLQHDAGVSIKNIHGKGYCLHVELSHH
ncbi:winged helix-turn-helix domain-containing protein [Chitinophaga nivalis]|uniref:Winged helix-turn-helix domain-containing protein n=1 Tax=Chitinophaga nivalis TaxID=2991709 RepID=A0ABT3IMV2_9BACT|nr:winged helix-turn-helix domain-containing protein [Chitinophaga nivalis]MCW3465012.1 winged helix-turn-helix domain-containing protein [Chitinophaga nivalis]MCW3485296.1 winged helix-turn-helix domain-containing protein [Chitinophaga nivalis]